MRFLIALIGSLAIWSAAQAADPDVAELVDAAIMALETKSYEARVHYFGTTPNSGEQIVYIHHIAPQLYHVEVIEQDKHGVLQNTGIHYIENAVEQVRVLKRGNEVLDTERMPERTFFKRDALTIKFLNDLASHPGTVVLNGNVNETPVYVLRQTKHPEKPYTITVGLDKENDLFPLYLLVTDSSQTQQIYYSIEFIMYMDVMDINPDLFKVSQVNRGKNLDQIGANQLDPDAVAIEQDDDSERSKLSVRKPSAAESEEAVYDLPLYPGWLPDGYSVGGLRALNYQTVQDGEKTVRLVYQYEILTPVNSSALSIFQAKACDMEFSADSVENVPDAGYIIQERDNWLVTVMGDLPSRMLEEIIAGLIVSDSQVGDLLELTRDRDLVQQQVVETRD